MSKKPKKKQKKNTRLLSKVNTERYSHYLFIFRSEKRRRSFLKSSLRTIEITF